MPESFIKTQIIALNIKEEKCLEAIKNDMSTLQCDISALLNKADCSKDIKKVLLEIESKLKINSDHFNAGKAIDEMPIIYESIELSGAPQSIEEIKKTLPNSRKKRLDFSSILSNG